MRYKVHFKVCAMDPKHTNNMCISRQARCCCQKGGFRMQPPCKNNMNKLLILDV